MTSALYTPEILRLALESAQYPRLASPQASMERRSPLCGSRVIIDVGVDGEGRVAAIGQEIRACALGQASAALMARSVVGRTAGELDVAIRDLRLWLNGGSPVPGDWPGLEALAPAIPHTARHAAILLAFEAAAAAAAEARP